MNLLRRGPHTISPTAHYTGYVWARNQIGAPELATPQGRLAHHALAPLMTMSGALGGPTLDGFLLARHRVIDHLLSEAIEAGRVGQVIELAAGMSPRGHSFAERFGAELTYIETDLPGMVSRKRRALSQLGTSRPGHRVEALDATRDIGPGSLVALVDGLDRSRGLAVITEGLLSYLPSAAVLGLWSRIARATGAFPHGLYLSDLHLSQENSGPLESAFAAVLGVAVRGRLHFHFDDAPAAEAALELAGFTSPALHRPADFDSRLGDLTGPGSDAVRVLAAHT